MTRPVQAAPAATSAPWVQRGAQRGGFAMGLVAGLLIGLALALAVALYITKAPIPFVDKVPQRTPEQDKAETERNRSWDPNALLSGKPARPAAASAPAPAPAASSGAPSAPAVAPALAGAPSAAMAKPPGRDPAAILAGAQTPAPTPAPTATPAAAANAAKPALEPFVYFVQSGAYTRAEDAEQQRVRLALIGQEAKVSEREQAGRLVYRVRLGPYPSRDMADGLQGKLQEQGIEAQIVRVERP